MSLRRITLLIALWLAATTAASAIILLETDDPALNISTPGDNSGWQYEGQFKEFLGTPIAPRYFLAANHVGVGATFIFHGETYQTTAFYDDPSTDLRIWQVDHDFPDYAPLYQGDTETGRELRVFGRGTQRGTERLLDGRLRGWNWGAYDYVPRWGRNIVARTATLDGISFLEGDFDSPGMPDEGDLSDKDSSGGVFVMEDGLWKLAAINYGVDDLYETADDSTHFLAALFDARGYYAKDAQGNFFQIPDEGISVPLSFYSTRVAPRLAWIQGIIGQDTAAIAPESYPAWLSLYFTPDQIADSATTGSGADADGDGIPNLLEFAFNLDPTFAELVQLTPGTGLRGLPFIQPETQTDGTNRLTVEYVRRTTASASGISYDVQWTSSLVPDSVNWQTGGTESVTPINARWERVKVIDPVAQADGTPTRFARVAVTLGPPVASARKPVE